ncbi:Glia-derived nexin [Thelohanellus kitauei]|uniref:Glia-derived nexin n=1 Tax=Thelohanellus kitauei TaxID=669202 RepID=A0A0C2JB26_THEKT|nr:Glia-derived nexin [Thelohanellus kitauei]
MTHLVHSQNYTGNIAFSGPSLYIMMSIIYAGLKGPIRTKLARLLGYDFYGIQYMESWSLTGIGYRLSRLEHAIQSKISMKSAIIYSFNISSIFVNNSGEVVDLEYQEWNFSNTEKMTRKINQWARKNTRGSIHDLYRRPLDKDTKMILITSLYMFADWWVPFDPMKTRYEIFTDDTGKKFDVKMMKQIGSYKIKTDVINNFSIIFIPMIKGGLYASIVLPRIGHPIQDTLKYLKVKHICKEWDNIQRHFITAGTYDAVLKLPKFKIITENRFINTFIHLNVSELFEPGMADFGFTTSPNVFINDFMQLTTIVVDEFSTGLNIKDEPELSTRFTRNKFYVDRSFLFLIYSSYSTEVLLSVTVTNPNRN